MRSQQRKMNNFETVGKLKKNEKYVMKKKKIT